MSVIFVYFDISPPSTANQPTDYLIFHPVTRVLRVHYSPSHSCTYTEFDWYSSRHSRVAQEHRSVRKVRKPAAHNVRAHNAVVNQHKKCAPRGTERYGKTETYFSWYNFRTELNEIESTILRSTRQSLSTMRARKLYVNIHTPTLFTNIATSVIRGWNCWAWSGLESNFWNHQVFYEQLVIVK